MADAVRKTRAAAIDALRAELEPRSTGYICHGEGRCPAWPQTGEFNPCLFCYKILSGERRTGAQIEAEMLRNH